MGGGRVARLHHHWYVVVADHPTANASACQLCIVHRATLQDQLRPLHHQEGQPRADDTPTTAIMNQMIPNGASVLKRRAALTAWSRRQPFRCTGREVRPGLRSASPILVPPDGVAARARLVGRDAIKIHRDSHFGSNQAGIDKSKDMNAGSRYVRHQADGLTNFSTNRRTTEAHHQRSCWSRAAAPDFHEPSRRQPMHAAAGGNELTMHCRHPQYSRRRIGSVAG